MRAEKAIERLETFVERHPGYSYSDLIPAVQLGIEALKRHQNQDRTHLTQPNIPLPGETKE